MSLNLYALVPKHRKPKRWRVIEGSLSPFHRSAFNKAEMLFPFWDSSPSSQRDIAHSVRSPTRTWINDSGSLAGNIGCVDGIAEDYIGSSSADKSSVDTGSTDASRSIMCVITVLALPSSGNGFIVGMGPDSGAWLHVIGISSNGAVDLHEVTGGETHLTSSNGLVEVGGRYAIVAVSDNSSGMRLHMNGQQIASNGTTGFLTLFGLALHANNAPPSHPNRASFKLAMAGCWKVALSVQEANAISGDPYGLIRPSAFVPLADLGLDASSAVASSRSMWFA